VRQTIYLRPDATEFDAVCEQCLADLEEPQSLASRLAHVHGTLRLQADVGFTSCGRGHRVRVRRVGRALDAPPLVPLRYGY
jgi:hypothetical protein